MLLKNERLETRKHVAYRQGIRSKLSELLDPDVSDEQKEKIYKIFIDGDRDVMSDLSAHGGPQLSQLRWERGGRAPRRGTGGAARGPSPLQPTSSRAPSRHVGDGPKELTKLLGILRVDDVTSRRPSTRSSSTARGLCSSTS